jgi:hypothetical protein
MHPEMTLDEGEAIRVFNLCIDVIGFMIAEVCKGGSYYGTVYQWLRSLP